MIGRRQTQPRFQSDFYRDNYRRLLIALFVSIVVMVSLVLAIIYFVLMQPQPKYYASTTHGRIIPMVPHQG